MRRNGLVSTKKADGILIAVILLAALVAFILRGCLAEKGSRVRVTVDGQTAGTYSLSRDQRIPIQGDSFENVLVIRDGQADMTQADCPDRICVRHKAISRVGETIICLPHKVIVTVEAGEEEKDPGIDGISR